jgi:hypothetical protein
MGGGGVERTNRRPLHIALDSLSLNRSTAAFVWPWFSSTSINLQLVMSGFLPVWGVPKWHSVCHTHIPRDLRGEILMSSPSLSPAKCVANTSHGGLVAATEPPQLEEQSGKHVSPPVICPFSVPHLSILCSSACQCLSRMRVPRTFPR